MIAIPGFSEPFSSLSHLFGALAAFVGGFFLCRHGRGNRIRVFSLGIFSFSLVFLFSMSGVYHMLAPGSEARAVFQRLDHAAIWVLIAGTFTPIHTLLFRGFWRWGFLILIWTIAITGMILEVVFFASVPEWLSLSFYLGLGWMGLLSGQQYARIYGILRAKLLVMGGLSYSIGAVMEFARWPVIIEGVIGPHELFHVFVIIGACYFWMFIYHHARYPVISRLRACVIEHSGKQFFAKVNGEDIMVEGHSLESIKNRLCEEVERRFPVHVRPQAIVLEFRREDKIYLRD